MFILNFLTQYFDDFFLKPFCHSFLGFVVEFFSYPVIAGFMTAAALNIGSSQINSLLGITGRSQDFLNTWIHVFTHIKETRKWDAILGFTTIVFLVLTKVRKDMEPLLGAMSF